MKPESIKPTNILPAALSLALLPLAAAAQQGNADAGPPQQEKSEQEEPGQPPEPAPGAPPAEYSSETAEAWGESPTEPEEPQEQQQQPAAQDAEPRQPSAEELEALKKKCAKRREEGLPLTDECRAAELQIVFQGGMGEEDVQRKAVPQAEDAESARMHRKKITHRGGAAPVGEDGAVDVWEVARREPPLFPDEPQGFFAAGLSAGYSWIFGRGAEVEHAYTPVIHLSAEGAYQLLRMFQLALVFDFDYLQGAAAAGHELKPEDWVDPSSGSMVYRRDVGAILDNYVGLGLRPSFRFNVHFSDFEWLAGVGLGWHYFSTSGRWRTKIGADDPLNSSENSTAPTDAQIQWNEGNDEAIYSFEESDSGLYGVFETRLVWRLIEGRLGAGFFLQYTLPIHGGIVPDVEVEQHYCETDPGCSVNPPANDNDYADTFIRHLGSMSLLSLGLAADYRF
ncbi:MAG: hypothetical protein R6V85_03095 [Polyangia bacterium]